MKKEKLCGLRRNAMWLLVLILLAGNLAVPVWAAPSNPFSIEIVEKNSMKLPQRYEYTEPGTEKNENATRYLLKPSEAVKDFELFYLGPSLCNALTDYNVSAQLACCEYLDGNLLLTMDVACGVIPSYGISFTDSEGTVRFFAIQEGGFNDSKEDPVSLKEFIPYFVYESNPFRIQIKNRFAFYSGASTSADRNGYGNAGIYTIVEVKNGMGRLKSGAGWVSLEDNEIIVEEAPVYKSTAAAAADTFPEVPFLVRCWNATPYYKSDSRDSGVAGTAKAGIYTIVEVKGSWGRLKSGVGWIYLGNSDEVSIMGEAAS